MRLSLGLAAATALASLPASASAEQLIVALDYDNPNYIAPGSTVTGSDNTDDETASTGAWNAAGWSGVYEANRSTGNPAELSFLSLGGLAPGSNVRIGSMLLGLLESWDSSDGGACCSPDYLDIFINGSLVASITTNNALGSVKVYSGATELFYREQLNANDFSSDTLLDLSTASFANSRADPLGNWSIGLQARGAGWEGGSNEAWGVDRIMIYGTLAPGVVPEPATWALMILGFGAVGNAMRKRSGVAFA